MTRTAANATAALLLLESGVPVDAVFSDVMMPGPMNGRSMIGRGEPGREVKGKPLDPASPRRHGGSRRYHDAAASAPCVHHDGGTGGSGRVGANHARAGYGAALAASRWRGRAIHTFSPYLSAVGVATRCVTPEQKARYGSLNPNPGHSGSAFFADAGAFGCAGQGWIPAYALSIERLFRKRCLSWAFLPTG